MSSLTTTEKGTFQHVRAARITEIWHALLLGSTRQATVALPLCCYLVGCHATLLPQLTH